MFRNCISLDVDEPQVSFIKMRINAIWECLDADEEVGAQQVGNTERFQAASREPMPPLANEAGEFGDLDDAPLCEQYGHEDTVEFPHIISGLQAATDTDNTMEDTNLILI
jgi:hypothetical protein